MKSTYPEMHSALVVAHELYGQLESAALSAEEQAAAVKVLSVIVDSGVRSKMNLDVSSDAPNQSQSRPDTSNALGLGAD